MFSSAISFTMRAHLRPYLFLRMCYRRVVFPAPKNPDINVTGNLLSITTGIIFSIAKVKN